MTRLVVVAVVAALAGLVLVAVGVGLWSVPAGLVVGGVELVIGAYVLGYLAARLTRTEVSSS